MRRAVGRYLRAKSGLLKYGSPDEIETFEGGEKLVSDRLTERLRRGLKEYTPEEVAEQEREVEEIYRSFGGNP